MNLQRSTDLQAETVTIGFETTMDDVKRGLAQYYSQEEFRGPYVSIIKGAIGSGKTVFMKHLFAELKTVESFKPYLSQNREKLPIFTSNTNAETSLHFLNVWRPIFQMMVRFHCKRSNLKCEHFVADCITKSGNADKVDLICELTGVDKSRMGTKYLSQLTEAQITPKPQAFPFVSRPDYEEQDKERLLGFLANLFRFLVGEGEEVSEWGTSSGSEGAQSRRQRRNSEDGAQARPPIIVCLDGAQRMCPTSWKLLDDITAEWGRVAIFLVIQSDEKDRLMIEPQSVAAFEQIWASDLDIRIVDLPILSPEQLGQLIVANAQSYKSTYSTEVQDMTRIVDPGDTIKRPEMGAQWQEALTEKWQLHYVIKSVDADILTVISRKCRSNPLLCLQYFVNMLQNDFVRV